MRLSAFWTVCVITFGALVEAAFKGWVDPDTPTEARKTTSFNDGKIYDLVMSDEFNREGRKFENGEDPMWTGIDKSDDDQTSTGRKSLHFYNHTQVTTANGHLVIKTTTEDTKWKGWNPYKKKYEQMSRHFKSGMVQSWNKFCFTGGILEVDVRFPGRSDIGGLWPAVWLLGNLGRATFGASTNLMWPWSYKKCDRDLQRAQEISGCDITEHYSLNPEQGRGATEIDVVEVMAGPSSKLWLVKNGVKRPYASMTLQLAPGVPVSKRRPYPGTLPEWGFNWYDNITYGNNVSINPYFYGTYLGATKLEEPISRSEKESYQADAVSSMMALDADYFNNFHTFRLEWQPGVDDDGYVRWYVDNEFRFGIEQKGLNKMNSMIPAEPSYVILNTAVSTSWGFPNPPIGCTNYDCKDPDARCGFNPGFCQMLPAEFLIDHVRVYQNKEDKRQTVGCNPREYPTKKWILGHEYRYKNLEDRHAIKETVTGGGKCTSDKDCGEGKCSFLGCRCAENWQGPNCLVPTYQNDFPDWDVDHWIPFSIPHIPTFLAFAAVILIGALVVASFVIVRKRRSSTGTDGQTAPKWSYNMLFTSNSRGEYESVPGSEIR